MEIEMEWKPKPLFDEYNYPPNLDKPAPVVQENHLITKYIETDDWRDGLPATRLYKDGSVWVDMSTGKKYRINYAPN